MRAFSASNIVDHIVAFTVVTTYPVLSGYIGSLAVLPLLILSVIDFTVVYSHLPETKGQTTAEISAKWLVETGLENK